MKILVLSLLRVGDLIQQIPLLQAMRQQYVGAEVHILLNQQFASAESLLDGLVDKFYYFDREKIQRGLGESAFNVLWSFSQVEGLVQSLNDERYDLGLNFTHNRLSSYIMGAIEMQERKGLFFLEGQFQGLENRWLKYFNDRFSGTQKSLFHYVELLGRSFNLKYSEMLIPTVRKKERIIFLQCLTSDKKKNWDLTRFKDLKIKIEGSFLDYRVFVLSAPFEKQQLLEVFEEKDLMVCDLYQVKKLLKTSELLVSGDTSIKHLAALCGTAVVEISLGSSDSTKTRAFINNSRVIKSSVSCAPCVHSLPCSQTKHLCSENIQVETVYKAVVDFLQGQSSRVSDINLQFERFVWEFYLENQSSQNLINYKSRLADLESILNSSDVPDFISVIEEQSELYRKWLETAFNELPSKDFFENAKSFSVNDISGLVLLAQDILRSKKDTLGYFQILTEALISKYDNPVAVYDKLSQALKDIFQLLEIRNKLIQYLKITSKEGDCYAREFGQLSVRCLEKDRVGLSRDFEDSVI